MADKERVTLLRPPPPDASLAPIENALDVVPISVLGKDIFTNARALWHPPGARGIYGGAVIAQCLAAGQLTVPENFLPHSCHCYFLLAGDSQIPVLYHVERVRDGRSYATRTVQARQMGKVIFTTTISFVKQAGEAEKREIRHAQRLPEGLVAPEDRIPFGDSGGELDPHGAENVGNPIGGNVTTNLVGGSDVFYEQWMSFISYDQYCLRICTAENANITTELQCEHELDIMGCQFVMAIQDFYTTNNTFTECEGEAAAAPGLYVQPNGQTSTFRQRYTGTYTNAGQVGYFTVGQTVTPSAPAFWPKSSNCHTYSTISNGVNTANWQVTAAPTLLASGSTRAANNVGSTSMSRPSNLPSASSGASSANSASRSGSAVSGSAQPTGSSARPSGSASGAAAGAASSGSAAGVRASVNMPAFVSVAAVVGAGVVGAAAVLL